MLAYAASRPIIGKREPSPNALLIVISVHVAVIAVVMSAKMDLPARILRGPPTITIVPVPVPPKPQHSPEPTPQANNWIERSDPAIKTRPIDPPPVVNDGPTVDPGAILGDGATISPEIFEPIKVVPVRREPRLLTPPSELKPPYPASKIYSEEEAVLTLRLTIDQRGRVVAVEPVNRVDREFLNSARQYLMAHWRYQPATEDGRAVDSSTVITLRFELDG